MVDSNVIIEYMKNNPEAIDIINFIKNNGSNEYYLTLDTIEEILYILVKHFSQKSYWDLKHDPEIARNIYKEVIPLIKSILNSFFKVALQTKNTHKIFLVSVKNMDYYLKMPYSLPSVLRMI